MTKSDGTSKGKTRDVITDDELVRLSKALSSAVANGAGIVELDATCIMLLVRELIQRRRIDQAISRHLPSEGGHDLKVRVNAYIDLHKGEWVSEIDIVRALDMTPDQASLRIIRGVLRQLDMAYVGLDKWREPIE